MYIGGMVGDAFKNFVPARRFIFPIIFLVLCLGRQRHKCNREAFPKLALVNIFVIENKWIDLKMVIYGNVPRVNSY